MTLLNKIFAPVLIFFGFNKKQPEESINEKPVPVLEGTAGLIEANSLIGREGGKIAIVLDYELGDIPSWVEWDIDLQQISIAQNGGAVAILQTKLSDKEAKDFESTKNLLLCTNIGTERVIHKIPLILRNSNDNSEDELIDFGQELAV